MRRWFIFIISLSRFSSLSICRSPFQFKTDYPESLYASVLACVTVRKIRQLKLWVRLCARVSLFARSIRLDVPHTTPSSELVESAQRINLHTHSLACSLTHSLSHIQLDSLWQCIQQAHTHTDPVEHTVAKHTRTDNSTHSTQIPSSRSSQL